MYGSLFGLHLWEGRRLYLNQAQPHLGAGVFSVAQGMLVCQQGELSSARRFLSLQYGAGMELFFCSWLP